MIKSVNNYAISDIFNIEKNFIYNIPLYQREYTWGVSQWENLFDDILENNAGYFLGSIICINKSTDTFEIQSLELVDGQQRLTTVSLLFAAMYHTLKEQKDLLDEDQNFELFNLKAKLGLKGKKNTPRLVPQLQNQNQNDFYAILTKCQILEGYDKPSYAGNRKIFRAFKYFKQRLAELQEKNSNSLVPLYGYLKKINQACLVKIEVETHSDAYTLFESLNNRGMPLTAIDLIKNKMLSQISKIEPESLEYYFNIWNKLLNNLGDDYAIQERFFRQYYNAFKEQLKDIYQVPVATRSNLISIYEKLITNNALQSLTNLTEASRLYSAILNQNSDDFSDELKAQLTDLEKIQGVPSYLLMLFLLSKKNELQLTDALLTSITALLVTFFVRRNLTDTPPTRDLTRIFMNIIENCNGKVGQEVLATIHANLTGCSADDGTFETKLSGPIYEENVGATRFILCKLAEKGMTKETAVDLWKYEKRQYVWTIEHILPQGENLPDCWVEMLAAGDKELAKTIQQEHAHKLGNLTISGFNSALGNKSFADKKNRKDKQGNYVGYKNGLQLNKALLLTDSWDEQQITVRTQDLVQETLDLFDLNKSAA